MGTFDGIQIGSTGLHAQRRGVDVAGQNIANVNTPGYTRQRVEITPDTGTTTAAIHSTWSGAGLGVRSVDITRYRDVFLERRAREEGALSAELSTTAGAYAAIERLMNEPSDTGLSSVMSDYFAAWDDVANRPDDLAARTQLVERGQTMASDINSLSASLSAMRDIDLNEIDALVAQVNADAAQVAALQQTIKTSSASGMNVNELLDQRDALLQGIAERVGGSARYDDDGTATFFVGGVALIRGSDSFEMKVQQTGPLTEVVWPLDGRTVEASGQVRGLLTNVNTIIPDFMAEVDAMASQLATDVNALHATGFDLDGNPGQDFFQITPTGIQVNAALLGDPRKVAASNAPGSLDGSVAGSLAEITGPADSYREMIVRLAVTSQSEQRRSDLQSAVVEQVQMEQEAANGVNLDEELADLVKFQRAYEANARFISTVDDLLGTLVNGTGRVGR